MRRTLCGLAIAVATLGPAWAVASEAEDKQAAQELAAVLRDSGKMKDYSVGVKFKNGTVWLAGRVTTAEQMQTALQLISDTEGVEQIVNNLTVAPPQAAAVRRTAAQSPATQSPATQSPQRQRPTTKAPVRLANATAPQQFRPTAAQAMPQHAAQGRAVPAGYRHIDCAPGMAGGGGGGGYPQGLAGGGGGAAYDQPHMPNYAWPSYAAAPNYAALTYPKQYSATAFPFIGPFYPYPQVPLGWRKVSLEWDDGWWFLDFDDRNHH